MTTLQQVELQCPICETRFRSQTVVSTNSFGGKRTDFHERAAGTQPLPFLIRTGCRCGSEMATAEFRRRARENQCVFRRTSSSTPRSASESAFRRLGTEVRSVEAS